MELFITGKMFSLLIYNTSNLVQIEYHEIHSGEKMEGSSSRKRFLSYGRHPPFFLPALFEKLMYSLISSASLVYKLTSDAQLVWHIILHCVIPPPANASGPSSLKNQKQHFVKNWEKEKKKKPTTF